MASNGNSAGGVVVAFALGVAAGAAIALLYAPAPGDETRRKLAERTREGREQAERLARQGREFINRQRDTITEAVEKGRDAFQKARKENL